MARPIEHITDELRAFIERQPVFFVGTAPLDGEGHVNVSPKGMDTLRVVTPRQVAYLDLTGSSNETSAHLMENGRITFMFCAFEGKPLILRLYGRGRTILPEAPDWLAWFSRFNPVAGTRQIIVADIDRVQTSCGMAVPVMRFESHRDQLVEWASRKGEDKLVEYQRKNNAKSIDGLETPLGAWLAAPVREEI